MLSLGTGVDEIAGWDSTGSVGISSALIRNTAFRRTVISESGVQGYMRP